MPILPVKNVAKEMESNLADDMAKITPSDLKVPMQGISFFDALMSMLLDFYFKKMI